MVIKNSGFKKNDGTMRWTMGQWDYDGTTS